MARSTPGEKICSQSGMNKSHAGQHLAFVANCDVVEKDSFPSSKPKNRLFRFDVANG